MRTGAGIVLILLALICIGYTAVEYLGAPAETGISVANEGSVRPTRESYHSSS